MTQRDRSAGTTDAHRLVGPTLLVLAVTLLLYGGPVPRLSEELYLPLVRRVADSSYLAGDWTFAGSFGEHWLFDHLFAPLAGAVSISEFGWIGRLVFWPILGLLLIRIGNRLGLTPWPAAAAVSLWIVSNQALMGSEWIVGTFEAKTVAYVCFLGALLAISAKRIPLALALLGLTVSFHPAVGMWGAWGAGIALLALPETRVPTLKWCWLAAIFAVPGVIGALSAVGTATPAVQRFVVLEAIPYHTDPFFGGQTLGYGQVALHVVTLAGMLAFNLWAYRRSARDLIQRFFVAFQIAAAVPFAIAFIARAFHVWDYLRLMPLRSFPLIVPLVFFFQAVRLAVTAIQGQGAGRRRRRRVRRRGYVALVAIVLLAVFPTAPLLAAPRLIRRNVHAWTTDDTMADSFGWVRRNLPRTTTCIFPLDRQDAFERAEVPQVVNWQAIPYDRLGEWKRRIDQLVGGADYFEGHAWHGDLTKIRAAYSSLTLEQINRVATRYGATCLVTDTSYPLQLLHTEGRTKVYAITPR